MIEEQERELLLKLFGTGHLNVPERLALPSGRVRLSIAKMLIQESLHTNGWFPGSQQFAIGDPGGEYLQLELDESGTIILHRNTECSLLRYAHQTETFRSMASALDAYLKEREARDLDGLKIDWDS
jgi:hypothetical protein